MRLNILHTTASPDARVLHHCGTQIFSSEIETLQIGKKLVDQRTIAATINPNAITGDNQMPKSTTERAVGLKELWEAAGYPSGRALCRASGVSQSIIARLANGQRQTVSPENLEKLRRAGIDVDRLQSNVGCNNHPAVAAFVERVKLLPLRHQVYLLAVVGCIVDSVVQDGTDAG